MFPDVNGPTNAGFERGQNGAGGQSVVWILTMRERTTSFRLSVSLCPLAGLLLWTVTYMGSIFHTMYS